jgi:hypothetical protein
MLLSSLSAKYFIENTRAYPTRQSMIYVHIGTRYDEATKYCPEIPDRRVLCCTCKY